MIRRSLLLHSWLLALLCFASPALAQQAVTPRIVEGTQVSPAYRDPPDPNPGGMPKAGVIIALDGDAVAKRSGY
jgi:hypothetical protein